MSEWTHHRARVASLTRSRQANDPELVDARRDLKAERLADYIKSTVDAAPPLNSEQRERLAALLRQGSAPPGGPRPHSPNLRANGEGPLDSRQRSSEQIRPAQLLGGPDAA